MDELTWLDGSYIAGNDERRVVWQLLAVECCCAVWANAPTGD